MLGLIGIIATIFLIAQTVLDRQRGKASLNWPTTKGKIISSTKNFFGIPTIVYEYTRDGQTRTSKRIAFTQSTTPKMRQEMVEKYKPGVEVDVHYCPQDTSLEVIEAGVHPGTKISYIIAFSCLAVIILSSLLSLSVR